MVSSLGIQRIGQRLGEKLTRPPQASPRILYGTVVAANTDGTLDIDVEGAQIAGVASTTACSAATAGDRCIAVTQGMLITVLGIIATA